MALPLEDRLAEVFTPKVEYDDQGTLTGLPQLVDAAITLGSANPVAHHVTNVVIEELPDGQVRAGSKRLGMRADGSCGSVTYDDTAVRARRVPLNGLTPGTATPH